VVDVRGDDGAAGRYLRTDEFGGDPLRQVGTPGLTAVLAQELFVARIGPQPIELHVLADGDVLHLRGNQALSRVVQLRDVGTRLGPAWGAGMREAQVGKAGIFPPPAAEFGAGTCQGFGISAFLDPGGAYLRQAGQQIDVDVGVGIGAGGIVEVKRRVLLEPLIGTGRSQGHLAHGHLDVGARALYVDLT